MVPKNDGNGKDEISDNVTKNEGRNPQQKPVKRLSNYTRQMTSYFTTILQVNSDFV